MPEPEPTLSEREQLATLPAHCIGLERVLSRALYNVFLGLPEWESVHWVHNLARRYGRDNALDHLVLLPEEAYESIVGSFKKKLVEQAATDEDYLYLLSYHGANVGTGIIEAGADPICQWEGLTRHHLAPKAWAFEFFNDAIQRRPLAGNTNPSRAHQLLLIHSLSERASKPRNEDYLIARRHPQSANGLICLLADGQGGQSNGAAAAKAACETAWRLASEHPFDSLLHFGGWQQILEQADLAAVATGGLTTLIAIALDHDLAAGASSGDCKAYFTLPNKNYDLAEWTQHQRRNPPVGSGGADFVPFNHPVISRGRLLIVSDGVWKYCGYENLRAAMQSPDPAASIPLLRAAVLQNSGTSLPDDFSVILVDIP